MPDGNLIGGTPDQQRGSSSGVNEHQPDDGNANPEDCGLKSPHSKANPTQSGKDNANQDDSGRFKWAREWKPIFEVTSLGVEVIGLIALILYTVVADLQWKATRMSNNIALSALRSADRPYIVFENFELATGRDVWFALKNTGRGPALNVAIRSTYMFTDAVPTEFPLPTIAMAENLSTTTIGPGSSMQTFVKHGEELTNKDRMEFARGQSIVLVYGEVTYSDIYGQTYSPRYCQFFNPDARIFINCLRNAFTDQAGRGYKPSDPK